MKANLTDHERHLIDTMRHYGYECILFETKVKLRQKGIRGFSSDLDIPWAFNSVFSAATHLIPIIRDDSYRLAIDND